MMRKTGFAFLASGTGSAALIAIAASCGGGTAISFDDAGLAESGASDVRVGDENNITPDSAPPGPRQPVASTKLIVQKIHLGEADRSGVKNPNAWKAFGRNIDGLVTNVTSASSPDLALVCKRATGAPATIHQDGNQGADNTWGSQILKLLDPFNPTPTKAANDQIAQGGRTPFIALDGTTGFFAYAEATTTPPTWAPTEMRALANEWVTNGKAPNSRIVSGGVGSDGFYESGVLAGTTRILLGSSNDVQPSFDVELRSGVIRMKLAADGSSATEGTISGVVATEELVAQLAKVAGRFSTDLCQGSTLEGIKAAVRQASDILVDGTQDPTKPCDGISIALGFEATRGDSSSVAPPVLPPADPCP